LTAVVEVVVEVVEVAVVVVVVLVEVVVVVVVVPSPMKPMGLLGPPVDMQRLACCGVRRSARRASRAGFMVCVLLCWGILEGYEITKLFIEGWM
jgi:hypothetical protein